MLRTLTFVTLLLVSALAANAQAAECEAADESDPCKGASQCGLDDDSEAVCPQADGPEAPCDGEVCAYGEEACTWCSGPMIDNGTAAPTRTEECENCRTLDGEPDAAQSKGAPGLGLLAGIGVVAAALVVARRF